MPSIAWFGYGNMGRAIARGATAAGAIQPHDILVIEPAEAAQQSAREDGCVVADHRHALANVTRTGSLHSIFLAVKPQSLEDVARDWAQAGGRDAPGMLVLSVMAGIRSDALTAAMGPDSRVIRAMPNTPAMVGAGMTAVAPCRGATDQDIAVAQAIFGAVGRTVTVAEELIDSATALSGSGPAYFLLLCEAMAEAGATLGLSSSDAAEMARQTLVGTAAWLADPANADATPAQLRARVTSKGGTTHAAVSALESGQFRELVRRALVAARDRGRELGAR
ncbi:MAG: pyrroline-5-carboxylate reductase [Planctomycetota bacterium]|nr:pyrroline-5-carboxylate reductase [Planctomycetota bacterium]MDA1106187.1 pyrroline-5-carboxylate reductase [Planctomycetota bacterium]